MRGYYSNVRFDIAQLLPAQANRIVDVGAGAGETTAWVKATYPDSYAIALEGNPAMTEHLAKNADEHHIVDLDGDLPELGKPDLILCLDVLEHLQSPLDVLKRLTKTMAPHGTVIVSLPNVAHYTVSLPLLTGRFDYADAGILDRTHLRFFVRRSCVALMNDAGLVVGRGVRTGFGRFVGPADSIALGCFSDQFTKQYIVAGTRGTAQASIRWSKI